MWYTRNETLFVNCGFSWLTQFWSPTHELLAGSILFSIFFSPDIGEHPRSPFSTPPLSNCFFLLFLTPSIDEFPTFFFVKLGFSRGFEGRGSRYVRLLMSVLHCNENPIYIFLSWELHDRSPNFHIHVSVSDLHIPMIGPHIFVQQIDCGNISKAHRHMNVEIGMWARYSFSWNICSVVWDGTYWPKMIFSEFCGVGSPFIIVILLTI